MPTAYQNSRDFMARGIAAVRAGAAGISKGSAQPGPEIKVDPFGPHNVSTPAALLKVASTILAARRQRANAAVAQETASMMREKTRAEIAKLRAEAAFAEGTGRQTTSAPQPPANVTLTSPVGSIKAGVPVDPRDVAAENARLNREATSKRASDRLGHVNALSASRASLANIDQQAKRDVAIHTQAELSKYEPYFVALGSGDTTKRAYAVPGGGTVTQTLKEHALDTLSKAAGMDLSQYGSDAIGAPNTLALQKTARAAISARLQQRVQRNIDISYAPARAKHNAGIEKASLALAADPGEAAAPPTDTILRYDEQGNPISAGP